MIRPLIRNDDVALDTGLAEIQRFCELCDLHGFTAMQCITPIGRIRQVNPKWTNDQIREATGNTLYLDNFKVFEYLRARADRDVFAVHGLWHTHGQETLELLAASALIQMGGFKADWYVPPFNQIAPPPPNGLFKISAADAPRIEEYLDRPRELYARLRLESDSRGTEWTPVVYLHSWRFENGPFTWTQLDSCLAKLTTLYK